MRRKTTLTDLVEYAQTAPFDEVHHALDVANTIFRVRRRFEEVIPEAKPASKRRGRPRTEKRLQASEADSVTTEG